MIGLLLPLTVTVAIAGDIDIATREAMRQALTAPLGSGPVHLEVDLSSVTFMDCSGLGVLLGVRWECEQDGGSMSLRAPSGAVRMLTETLGLGEVLRAEP